MHQPLLQQFPLRNVSSGERTAFLCSDKATMNAAAVIAEEDEEEDEEEGEEELEEDEDEGKRDDEAAHKALDAQLAFDSTPLSQETESWEERRMRLLSLRRTDPTQRKYSKTRVKQYDDGSGPIVDWRLTQKNIDQLNNYVPDQSSFFDYSVLTQRHQKRDGKSCNWIGYMHDCNLTSRNEIEKVIDQRYRGEDGSRWRLFDALPDYAEPWNTLSFYDICSEFETSYDRYGRDVAAKEYIKHLQRRYDGEVALSIERWVASVEDMPRHKEMWQPQFAKNADQRRELFDLQWAGSKYQESYPQTRRFDLSAVGDTMILRRSSGGHSRLEGRAITLMELFAKCGKDYTAQECFFWYYHAPKVAKKRMHPQGSKDNRDAAKLRFKEYGHYGHRN
jgi:hypothetical protein